MLYLVTWLCDPLLLDLGRPDQGLRNGAKRWKLKQAAAVWKADWKNPLAKLTAKMIYFMHMDLWMSSKKYNRWQSDWVYSNLNSKINCAQVRSPFYDSQLHTEVGLRKRASVII